MTWASSRSLSAYQDKVDGTWMNIQVVVGSKDVGGDGTGKVAAILLLVRASDEIRLR